MRDKKNALFWSIPMSKDVPSVEFDIRMILPYVFVPNVWPFVTTSRFTGRPAPTWSLAPERLIPLRVVTELLFKDNSATAVVVPMATFTVVAAIETVPPVCVQGLANAERLTELVVGPEVSVEPLNVSVGVIPTLVVPKERLPPAALYTGAGTFTSKALPLGV